MAPEVYEAFEKEKIKEHLNAYQADIYSLGLIVLRMMVGKNGFEELKKNNNKDAVEVAKVI